MDTHVGRIRIPQKFADLAPHFKVRWPTMAGVSGGRTSGLMHVLALLANGEDPNYVALFANTGKEHEKTLDFVQAIAEATERPFRWIEVRKPAVYGAPPKDLRVEEVVYETASRNGEPLRAVLETMRDYRAVHKGMGPAVPTARGRTCTAYAKIRAMHRWCLENVGKEYDKFIGLRADEPERVGRIRNRDRAGVFHYTPLADAGITKADVLDFWKYQDFDLDIPEHMGNCTMCFLKDEADLARVAYERPEDATWWLSLQAEFGQFRASDRVPMAQISMEAGVRLEIIAPAVARGEMPDKPTTFDERRWRLLVTQERRRLKEKSSFSCACESVQLDVDDDDE
jgi:3'-phosphoadenosine 5'-phosphosulfate sulfotransferase (PAPS reductase)/FAD synthetase